MMWYVENEDHLLTLPNMTDRGCSERDGEEDRCSFVRNVDVKTPRD